ncbi:RHS repeat-associated core domain-containing protein [Weeksella virosa]|uniref:RHS repeat-associated core domain protein n=1 Tax=Weeksella virosa (strain ATCC 43766 / DSM 16922 / JCM 21250 / CCUG 30538 / CDC 9751 / IAM 14551 / NBRC 16016 / NCTC 11634 / CL345/78) TaxID=865938 RepID=F0P175_WEEVC|nr:RHS repeat-associated core domain-containing protein [Weeksella virosa]ADX67574.1 RHS repeat-associated core domain protein [Weeksella virosa DSM 16922]VEH64804.1 RHS repeat-associated core domain [Weeksella virosa]
MIGSHYYPFGLKHTGYNDLTLGVEIVNSSDVRVGIGVVNMQTSGSDSYNYKFLGQERQDELGLNWDTFRYRNYDYAIGRFFGVDPITEDYMSISPYQFAHNNPVWKIELEGLEGIPTTGQDVINREPRVLAVFYHGGPDGDGKIRSTTEGTGGAGDRFQATASYARSQGMDFKGAVISPSLTQGPGVETGKSFLESNYQEGDMVVVYGYSYGGDNAVNLAEAVPDIPINTMVIVDSSDGPLRGATVNTTIPDNVNTAYNFYQDNSSGASSSSRASGSSSGATSSSSGSNSSGSSNRSNSGSSNSPGSRGYPHSSGGSANVKNIKITGDNVNHGNIQTTAGQNIQSRINQRIDEYGN